MDKPYILRFVSWLARRLGRERFLELQCRAYGRSLAKGRQGAEVECVLRRVTRWAGREASPDELKAFAAELVWIYSDVHATVHLLDENPPERLLSRIELPLLPELERLRRGGKGVVLASPHFGNIALAMAGLVYSGVPLSAVLINAKPWRWVERSGLKVVDLGSSAIDCVRALNRNEAVLLLNDLDFFPGGRTAEFFGAPVHPPHGPARLALACAAPILPVYAVHEGAGRYRLVCDKALSPEGATQEQLEDGILRSMESFIGRHPSQWWVFRDIWDLERADKLHQRRLLFLARWRRLTRPGR